MKRVGLFHGLQKRHTVRKACWPLQWTTQAQRSMRGGEEGAPVTRPVGILDPAPPKGCSCVERLVRFCQIVDYCKTTGRAGRTSVCAISWNLALTWLNLVQLGCLVRHVRPSCPTWLLLGSNLVHLCSNLAQLSANLAQLGRILAQFASNLVQLWSQLGPAWSQNLTKMSFKRCLLATPSDLKFSIDF